MLLTKLLRYYALILPRRAGEMHHDNRKERHVVQFSSHINTRHDQPLGPSLQYYISGEAGRSREDVSASYESVGSADKIYRRKDLILIARASFTNSTIPQAASILM